MVITHPMFNNIYFALGYTIILITLAHDFQFSSQESYDKLRELREIDETMFSIR